MNITKPNKYNHSKLYKLQCDDGYYYIGCTTQALSARLGGHKTNSKVCTEQKIYSHINNIGWDHVRIILISEHNLENREQLLREEDRLIKECKNDPLCLNTNRAYQTIEEFKEYQKKYEKVNVERIKDRKKEYRKINADKIKEYNKEYIKINADKIKEYYIENRDKILNKHSESIECICGISYTYGHKTRHEKTIKHINYINDNNTNNIDTLK